MKKAAKTSSGKKSAFRRVEAGGRGALSRERAKKMEEFKSGLAKIVGNPCVGLRPFVCDGSPLDCRVFLVGINPATDMPENFWDARFWNDGSGFDKEKWLVAYRAVRKNAGKSEHSPSRDVIGRIVDAARPASCLETNLFSIQALCEDGLQGRKKDTAVFEFLLQEIRPRVVAVFSEDRKLRKEARRILGVGCAESRNLEEFGGKVFPCGNGVTVVFVRHYTRWSHANARKFGEWLRKEGDV